MAAGDITVGEGGPAPRARRSAKDPYHLLVSFADVGAEVFGLYQESRFADALAVVRGVRDRFPLEDATLTFWEACLLSMDGCPDLALLVLRDGIDRDLWWSETMLADASVWLVAMPARLRRGMLPQHRED